MPARVAPMANVKEITLSILIPISLEVCISSDTALIALPNFEYLIIKSNAIINEIETMIVTKDTKLISELKILNEIFGKKFEFGNGFPLAENII